jgi:hypothetical protein
MCKNKAGANRFEPLEILKNARISLYIALRFNLPASRCVLQQFFIAGFFTKPHLAAQGLCRKNCGAARFLPLSGIGRKL